MALVPSFGKAHASISSLRIIPQQFLVLFYAFTFDNSAGQHRNLVHQLQLCLLAVKP